MTVKENKIKHMKNLTIITTALLLIFNLVSFNVQATTLSVTKPSKIKKEFVKTINKEFDITADGKVGLSNRYGKIDLKTWNENKVKIDVKITVNASSEENAQEEFERINVNFSNGNDYVNAETTIESKKSSWWSWGSWSSSSDFSIDYDVYMPKSNNLNLANKYGHSTVDEIDGKATISVKYGDITMEGVNNTLDFYIGYGNGTILKATDIEGEVSYGKLKMNHAENVEITSKYSKVYLDEAKEVRSTSKYDTYKLGVIQNFRNTGKYDNIYIESVNDIVVDSKYSDIEVEQLTNSADLDLHYGGASIEGIASGFTDIRLEGNYADFKIRTDSNVAYHLDASGNYSDVYCPEEMDVSRRIEKGNSVEVEGVIGSANARGKIKARLNYGHLKIR